MRNIMYIYNSTNVIATCFDMNMPSSWSTRVFIWIGVSVHRVSSYCLSLLDIFWRGPLLFEYYEYLDISVYTATT